MNKDLEFCAGDVKEALFIINETANRLIDDGQKLWDLKELTFENIGSAPVEFVTIYKNGESVGAFILNFEDKLNWDDIDAGTSGFIHKLCVRKKFLKTGIVDSIVKYCEDICRKKGIQTLRLDTDHQRKGLVKLYERLGFKFQGIKNLKKTECSNITAVALYAKKI